jgi:glutamate racemase
MRVNSLPIGLFDSGVGGLTVFSALCRRLPDEDYLYLGDTARLPYGAKSPETITRYSLQVCSRLLERKIKLLVVACNTASAIALSALRGICGHLPIIGVVEPGAQAAAVATKTGRIAVIGTASTIRGGAYAQAITAIRPQAEITGLATPLLVPMAEEGWFNGPLVESIIARYLTPLFEARPNAPDCLVLGCTHFPMLSGAIQNVVGPDVTLVDSAQTTAAAVARLLDEYGLARGGSGGRRVFMTTDDAGRFASTGSLFLGVPIAARDVELIDL